jgi:lipopolysaccharide/colanic/teichoic acid biosynthesis glycosyltransferase
MTPAKRVFDLVMLGVSAPIFLIVAIWIKLDDQGSVFFVSERMKTATEPFQLIKFRTMTTSQIDQDSGVTGGNKASRITKAGGFLRRTRLDELPQLLNVIRGDVSLVGPRPPLRKYVDLHPHLYSKVLKSRPGLTGLATLKFHKREGQLLAGCKTADETHDIYSRRCVPVKARLDLIYQERRSLCFDLALIGRTALKPFRRN